MSQRHGAVMRLFCIATISFLIFAAADAFFDVVDLYNAATGAWSTARLSVVRQALAATSVENLALFAGGYAKGVLMCKGRGQLVVWTMCIC